MNDLEHHELFIVHIKKLKFEIDELNKMLESRLDILTKYICENELNQSSHKSARSEVFRAIEGANTLCQLIYQDLIKQLEKSFHRVEENEEEKNDRVMRGA